ncbi:MAG: glycosyltransferase family 39 protein [Anaerolineae bacterium]|nr:glycosyltransferase family 39 protein [Anaerolineae bacterium]
MAKQARRQVLSTLILIVIVVGAFLMRVYNIKWDNGYLFHPDERQILLVADDLSFPWPPDASLLTPDSSWNPGFFAYGSLPIYLLRLLADLAGQFDVDYATLESSYMVGRLLSALFDVGTVYLVYRLGRKLYGEWTGLLAAAFVCLAVLHIQLAHFYTVDSLLAFFVTLTIVLAVHVVGRTDMRLAWPLGVAWGMALATKVSAAPLLVPIVIAWVMGTSAARSEAQPLTGRWACRWWRPPLGIGLTGLVALVTFLLCEPYALIDVVSFAVDVMHESYMARGVADIPYTRQFLGTLPYLYPIWQAVVWSLGIPLGLTGFLAIPGVVAQTAASIVGRRWQRFGELSIPLVWFALYFGIVGSFHVKFLRYMLPVLPLLCLWAAWALTAIVSLGRRSGRVWLRAVGIGALALVLGATGLYAAAFLHIYSQEHTWIQATAWLCENLPQPSPIMVEHWDDPLPLLQGTGALRCYRRHDISQFAAYDPDDTAKLEDLLEALIYNEYIVLSSNRLYNTIPRLPERYPLTSRYYELLLGERLGFELVYFAAEYPQLLGVKLVNDTFANPRLPKPPLLAEAEAEQCRLNLGRADESYSVYDHPMPLVFAKTQPLDRSELLALFGDAAVGLPPPEVDFP